LIKPALTLVEFKFQPQIILERFYCIISFNARKVPTAHKGWWKMQIKGQHIPQEGKRVLKLSSCKLYFRIRNAYVSSIVGVGKP